MENDNRPLSPGEIDALLSGLGSQNPAANSNGESTPGTPPIPPATPEEDSAPMVSAPVQRVETAATGAKPWDFTASTRFTPDVLRAVLRVTEQSHLMIQTLLPASFRAAVSPGDPSVQSISFERYLQVPKDHGACLTMVSNRMAAPILLLLDDTLTSAVLDRELGGTGTPSALTRTLSPLELNILNIALEPFVQWLTSTFQLAVADLRLTMERVVSASQMQSIVSPTESVLWVEQPITFGNTGGIIHMVLPYVSIEPILPSILTWQAGWGQNDAEAEEEEDALHPALGIRDVVLQAVLPPVMLTVRQVMDLSSGDIILLPNRVSDGYWVLAEGRPTYWGSRLGQMGPRLAVQIEEVLPGN